MKSLMSTCGMILVLAMNTIAQCPGDGFTTVFGGDDFDQGHGISVAAGGGFFVGGTTESFGAGSRDFIIIKFNEEAEVQWAKAIGTAQKEDASFMSVKGLADGGVAFVGFLNPSEALRHTVIGKLDASGNEAWFKELEMTENISDTPRSAYQLANGDIVFIGTSNGYIGSSDGMIIRTTNDGVVVHARTYGNSDNDHFNRCVEMENGNIAVVGITQSAGTDTNDGMVCIFSPDLTLLETHAYTSNVSDGFHDVFSDGNGGLFVCGNSVVNGAMENILVMHLDANMEILWQKGFGGENRDFATSVQLLGIDELMVVSSTESFGDGTLAFLLTAMGADGTVSWHKVMSFTSDDGIPSVSPTPMVTDDGSIWVCGWTNSFSSDYQMALHQFNYCGDNGCSVYPDVPMSNSNLLHEFHDVEDVPLLSILPQAFTVTDIAPSQLVQDEKCSINGITELQPEGQLCAGARCTGCVVWNSIGQQLKTFSDVESALHWLKNVHGSTGIYYLEGNYACPGSTAISAVRRVVSI